MYVHTIIVHTIYYPRPYLLRLRPVRNSGPGANGAPPPPHTHTHTDTCLHVYRGTSSAFLLSSTRIELCIHTHDTMSILGVNIKQIFLAGGSELQTLTLRTTAVARSISNFVLVTFGIAWTNSLCSICAEPKLPVSYCILSVVWDRRARFSLGLIIGTATGS